MKCSINQAAWNGNWYARVLSRKGDIGTKDSKGSKIYLNAQTWAVLADVADDEKLRELLQSV